MWMFCRALFVSLAVQRERERERERETERERLVLLFSGFLFVLLDLLCWLLWCLFLFDIRIMTTHLVSSNTSCVVYSIDGYTFSLT